MLGNYKIRVDSKAESKEAQELLFELGYYWAYRNIGKKFSYEESDVFLFANADGIIGAGGIENTDFFNSNSAKEITLPQLRDLVVQSKKEQGLISGVEAFNASMNGERVLWRYKENDWQEWDEFTAWSKSALTDSNYSFKIKPSTVKIEIEVPAPFDPKVGDYVYFLCSDETKGYAETTLEDTPTNWGFVQFGAWRTEKEIKQVVTALRSALTTK